MLHPLPVLFAIGSMEGGGAERQVVEILKHLDRSRFEPSLYLVNRRGELLGEVPGDVPITAFSDVNWTARWNYPGRFRRTLVAHLVDAIRDRRAKIVYDRCYPMTTIAAEATRRIDVARVSAAAGDPWADLAVHPRLLRPFYRRRARLAYRTADRVLANSAGLRQRMIEYYRLPAERVTTAYNLVDFERIDRLADERPPTWQSGCFHIVCSGRLHYDKGYLYLLGAIDELVNRRNLKNLRLHIFGQGPQEQELKRFVTQHGLDQYVRFEGFHHNPFAAFRQAQLFCLPSLTEGMPNAVVEAIICRLPVLATDCHSGPREILDGGRYGRLVPPADAAALADAIADAIQNHAAWTTQLEGARRHVIQTYSVESGMKRLEDVLTAVART
jgi:glycosyltransferase involved in cell wall biosynthesis